MYGAHESYRKNCRLSVSEVDFLVEAVRKRGPASGLFGAKITGGGTGGTVAVFGTTAAPEGAHPAHRRRIFPPRGRYAGHFRRHVAGSH